MIEKDAELCPTQWFALKNRIHEISDKKKITLSLIGPIPKQFQFVKY